MRKSGIYRIVNLVTGKIYVGSAVSLSRRFNNHKSDLNLNKHDNKYLQNAWNKYWQQSFKFEIIECCEKEKLLEREQYWINTLNCVRPNGYNLNPIAGSNLGMVWSDEFKAKVSKALKGRKLTEKHKAKKFKYEVGHKPTQETCFKISAALKGKKFSDEHRANLSIARQRVLQRQTIRAAGNA